MYGVSTVQSPTCFHGLVSHADHKISPTHPSPQKTLSVKIQHQKSRTMAPQTATKPQKCPSIPHTENPNDYRKDGFHPIHIGDRISKYTIIDKLGFGDSSTVWLASSTSTNDDSCVAIAVKTAEASAEAEARTRSRWWRLNDGDQNHPGRGNVLVPEELLTVEGPNGKHLCIVTAVQGQSVSAATGRGSSDCRPLPVALVKRVVLEMVGGLEYSHAMGLTHSGELGFLDT